jgi:type IV pilus assembly protein PilV
MKTMHSQHGFSMIELLVAVLVMGIGVLGITGLQMVSLQNNRGALVRAEAVQLAYDVMDRIRANPTGNYDGIAIGAGPVAPGINCMAADCPTDANMAAFDIAVWKCSLGNYNTDAVCNNLRAANVLPAVTAQPGLPSGDGSIAVAGNGVVTVTVQWQEPNQPNPSTVAIDSRG